MRFLIIFFIIFFLFLAFFGKLSYAIGNPFLNYLIYILNFFVKFFPVILIIFSATSGYFIWRHYRHKHSRRKTAHSFIQIFEILLISIFSAFVLLFLIGFIQLNIYSLLLNKNPALLGIKVNTEEIYNNIKNNNIAPNLVIGDKNSRNNIISIAKATSGTDNFYGEIVLSNVPRLLILPVKNEFSDFLLVDNTLIITGSETKDIEKLSSLISHLFLSSYFQDRNIKAYPKVSVMDEADYLKFRKEDAKEKLERINSEALRMESSIGSMSAGITETEVEIETNKENQLSILEQRDDEYNQCLSEGIYDEDNNFIPDNSKADCQFILDNWEPIYIGEQNSEKELAEKLIEDQEKLKVYEYYDNFFKAQEQLSDISVENIPSELGVFIPEDQLKVVLLNSDSKTITNYFTTLIHEYLHYASYIPEKRLESSFFEEGLTEYFARKTIKQSMDLDVNSGYPVAYKIIEQITKRVPETDLAEIYFTKDQKKLEETLDLVYGEEFYKDNIVYFETLMYIGGTEKKLELANTIIKKFGGSPLTEDDIFSD